MGRASRIGANFRVVEIFQMFHLYQTSLSRRGSLVQVFQVFQVFQVCMFVWGWEYWEMTDYEW